MIFCQDSAKHSDFRYDFRQYLIKRNNDSVVTDVRDFFMEKISTFYEPSIEI